MHLHPALALVLISLLAGCGDAPPEATAPGEARAREVAERYLQAVRDWDWSTAWELGASESRQGLSREAFVARKRGAPAFARVMAQRARHEIVSVRIEGSRASVELRVEQPRLGTARSGAGLFPSAAEVEQAPLVAREQRLALLEEDGDWRVVLPLPPRPGPEAQRLLERALEQQKRGGP